MGDSVRRDLIQRNAGPIGNFPKSVLMRFLDLATLDARNFLGCYSWKITLTWKATVVREVANLAPRIAPNWLRNSPPEGTGV